MNALAVCVQLDNMMAQSLPSNFRTAGSKSSCPGESPSRLMPVEGQMGGSLFPDSSGETEGFLNPNFTKARG